MSKLVSQRSEELHQNLMRFKNIVFRNISGLKQNMRLHFMMTLTKKQLVVCQYEAIEYFLDISFCKSNMTLLKRLSYLQAREKLKFVQNTEIPNQFFITLNFNQSQKNIRKVGQMQFLF